MGHGFSTHCAVPAMHLVQDCQEDRKTQGFWETLNLGNTHRETKVTVLPSHRVLQSRNRSWGQVWPALQGMGQGQESLQPQ